MTHGGTNLEVERWIETTAGPVHLRELGPPTGAPLLFVHGALVDSHLWDGVAERAAALGYRCLLPTLPLGSHTRPMNPGADLDPPALADLAAEVVEQLGLRAVTVVGNDTGGGLSQILAARHPELVRTLVLTACDAYEQFPPRSLRAFFALGRAPGVLTLGGQLMRLRTARRFAIPRPLSHRGVGDEMVAGWTRPLRDRALRRDTVKFFAGIEASHTLAAARQLRHYTGGALLVWGSDDRVFGLELGRRLAADIPGARLEILDDCGAFVPLDAPDRVAELIDEWLTK
ncbi:alpha/beta fold hydrolase [Rhodococcus sp. UNC363MFTsu5.1]|uniref:alpha/beta fold hydrolase n=1 Tax=Rhodococcus sp. UNC363MFTsu5.1 TaxID=1449069 RepID=UPI00068AA087|nr:alpha/beta hydrolase [Rhodococcus sp. UNC363MFTsu5.1]